MIHRLLKRFDAQISTKWMQKVEFSSLLLKSVDEFYRTNQGLYPKNIRQYSSFLFFFFLSEWACFLCSPLSDPYFDSLALTRTLGDFHLQTYGLTYSFTLSSDAPRYVPSISCIDLRESITVKYDYSLMNHKTDLLNDIDNCRNKKEKFFPHLSSKSKQKGFFLSKQSSVPSGLERHTYHTISSSTTNSINQEKLYSSVNNPQEIQSHYHQPFYDIYSLTSDSAESDTDLYLFRNANSANDLQSNNSSMNGSIDYSNRPSTGYLASGRMGDYSFSYEEGREEAFSSTSKDNGTNSALTTTKMRPSLNNAGNSSILNNHTGVIVLGSDGFWDNWTASYLFELLLSEKQSIFMYECAID